jgi:hypothetical protein
VLGYGVFEKSDEKYRAYLDHVAEFVKQGNVRIEDAVSNQVSTAMEILSLYDKELDELMTDAVKIKHGLV